MRSGANDAWNSIDPKKVLVDSETLVFFWITVRLRKYVPQISDSKVFGDNSSPRWSSHILLQHMCRSYVFAADCKLYRWVNDNCKYSRKRLLGLTLPFLFCRLFPSSCHSSSHSSKCSMADCCGTGSGPT